MLRLFFVSYEHNKRESFREATTNTSLPLNKNKNGSVLTQTQNKTAPSGEKQTNHACQAFQAL